MLQDAGLQVSSVPQEVNPVGGASGAKRAMEAKEQFLKMLVAQISNQSPTNPMDDKDMVSQLAQFSSIEQAIETNSKLEALEHAQTVATKLSVASLIGKQASASTAMVGVTQEGAANPISFELGGRAKDVNIDLLDNNDKVVRSLNLKAMGPGGHTISWDGKGANKLPLPAGNYRPVVNAIDNNNEEVSVRHEIRGIIHRVDVEGEEPALYVNDRRVSLREISQISD
jgi:flagellar basal-body rod modification protein FlgD